MSNVMCAALCDLHSGHVLQGSRTQDIGLSDTGGHCPAIQRLQPKFDSGGEIQTSVATNIVICDQYQKF